MMRWLLPIIVAGLLAAACGGDNPEPTPTPDATQPPFITATPVPPTPTITPSPTPVANVAIRVLHFALGEPIEGVTAGALFMDVASGEVEVVTSIDEPIRPDSFTISPDNRFVYVANPVSRLLDRATGKVWDATGLPGTPLTNGNDLLAAEGLLVFETEGDGEFIVTDADMREVARFELTRGDPNRRPIQFWPAFAGPYSLVSDGALKIVDLSAGTGTSLSNDGFTNVSNRPQPLTGRLAITLTNRSDPTEWVCTLWEFSWNGELLLKTDVEPCREQFFPDEYDVSPDGQLVAVWRGLGVQEEGGVGGNPILGAVYVYDATTGDVLFRVKGAALPHYLRVSNSRWLADGSALVIQTRDGNRLVTRDGEWIPGTLPGNFAIPSPLHTDKFAIDRTGVLHEPTGEFLPLPIKGLAGFINPWGIVADEARFVLPVPAADDADILPVAAPAIEFPPFGRDTVEVFDSGTCLNVSALPDVTSDLLICLLDGTPLNVHPIDLGDIPGSAGPSGRIVTVRLARGEACFGDPDYCLWVSVQTPSGQTGWAAAQYLRWPGTPPPEVE